MARHLAPDACYVCGADGYHADSTATGGHRYWSNAAADNAFAAEPTTTYSPEAAYVAAVRPY